MKKRVIVMMMMILINEGLCIKHNIDKYCATTPHNSIMIEIFAENTNYELTQLLLISLTRVWVRLSKWTLNRAIKWLCKYSIDINNKSIAVFMAHQQTQVWMFFLNGSDPPTNYHHQHDTPEISYLFKYLHIMVREQ